MSKRLDDLSRNLASGMSRRRALQIFAGGLAAAALGRSAIGVEAAGSGTTVANFCKAICTPYFTGRGNRGFSGNFTGNYYLANYEFSDFEGNYYANYTPYDECMAECHLCDANVANTCGSDICVQAEDPRGGDQPAIYCLSS
jgi:hypothetical protein